MRSFTGFPDFLNEMFVDREEGGKTVIAFRQWLWLVNYDSNKGQEIVDKISTAHPRGQELLKHLRGKDLYDVLDWVKEYIPDAIVADWSADNKTLWLHGASNMGVSPTTSPLIRKVAIELRARKVKYSGIGGSEDGDERTISRGRKHLRGDWSAVWYHGTSTKYIEEILKFGLKPGESDSNYADQGIYHDDAIFLTAKVEEAQYHGWHTARKVSGIPTVVQIEKIPDPSLLIPDYDVDNIASRNTYNNPSPKDYDPVFSVNSMKASKHAGLVGYRGRIPANHIVAVLIYSENRGGWVRIRDIKRLRSALANHGEDFWYRYGEPVITTRRRY